MTLPQPSASHHVVIMRAGEVFRCLEAHVSWLRVHGNLAYLRTISQGPSRLLQRKCLVDEAFKGVNCLQSPLYHGASGVEGSQTVRLVQRTTNPDDPPQIRVAEAQHRAPELFAPVWSLPRLEPSIQARQAATSRICRSRFPYRPLRFFFCPRCFLRCCLWRAARSFSPSLHSAANQSSAPSVCANAGRSSSAQTIASSKLPGL
jgi:hypothetical protein